MLVLKYLCFFVLFSRNILCAVLVDQEGTNIVLNTPRLYTGPEDFDLLLRVELASPFSACEEISPCNGSILLIEQDNCSPSQKIANAQSAGAGGVLLTQYRTTDGLLWYYSKEQMKDEIFVPAVEVSFDDSKNMVSLLEEGNALSIKVDGKDENPLVVFGEAPWVIYSVLLLLYGGPTLVMACRKLYLFRMAKTEFASLPILTLSMVVFVWFLRIPILIDPTGSRRLMPWPAIEFFFTVDFSFVIVTNLLIAFYWNAIMVNVTVVQKFSLRRFRLPCIILCIGLLLLEFTTSLLRAAWLSARLFIVAKVLLYCILSLAVSIYFFKTGWNIYKFAQQSLANMGKESFVRRQKSLRKVSFFFFVSCHTNTSLFSFSSGRLPSSCLSAEDL